jgi:SPP1 family predicted phage head-tail adaptor
MTGPGDLRHRLTLQEVQRVGDGAGGATTSWSDVADVWAQLTPAGGSEGIEAGRLAGKRAYEIVLRYRDGVQPAMRFRFGTRILEILTVVDVGERRRWLRCLCEERDL